MITEAEWAEIGAIQDIRDMWGVGDGEIFFETASIYGVKFNFMEDGPGYAGDLFILHGGSLTEEAPLRLIRDRSGKIVFPQFVSL